jgi:surfactin synthase thioesterase subunit
MPVWLFLSGRRAPDVPSDTPNLRSLPDREFLNQLANTYQGLAAEFLNNPDMLEVFLPILRADISIVESYAFAPTEPLTCPLTVFAGKDDPTATWEMIRPWSRQTRGPFALQLFPGGHFYPHPPLLQTIGETLRHLPPTA